MVDETWIVGVSGGPDSMALLDIMHKKPCNIIAAHVNYHKRNTSDRDENFVRDYAQKNDITFEIKNFPATEIEGNFQDVARKFRYDFFKELSDKYNACGVVIAHHFDDDLETYLFQKERNMQSDSIGLSNVSLLQEMTVWRPLLDWTKDELIKYCNVKEISFGVDESNASNVYSRNRIRKHLESMSHHDKAKLIDKMSDEKKLQKIRLDKIHNIVSAIGNPFALCEYEQHDDEERILILRYWFRKYGVDTSNLSRRYLNELDRQILTKKFIHSLDTHILSVEYGECSVFVPETFEYKYDALTFGNTSFFSMREDGSTIEGVTLLDEDFPITIRNAQEGDKILMRFGTKALNRFFIDRKIPQYKRAKWPVVVNSKGDVVFVVGLGCDAHHYSNNHNLFVIEL